MSHAALIIAVAGAVTLVLRFLPFVIFGRKETPAYISYLGRVLPYAIMGMLVVYCLRGISFASAAAFLPELIACTVVVLAHMIKRNTLLSIISGTVCYMLLVQLVF